MSKKKTNNNYSPPESALNFLFSFCSDRIFEEVEGDLIERFERRKDKYPKFLNRLIFWFETIGFFRPAFWKNNLFENTFWGVYMFKSNLKFAIRNIYKNFFFSAMNISGLAIGIACVLFIFFYLQNELSFDRFNEKGDRICRVLVDGQFSGNVFNSVETGGVVGPTMLKDFPEVENFCRIDKWGIMYVKHEDVCFKEENIISADSTFFDLFSIPVIKGDPEKILALPWVVAISRRAAEKYFGREDPIGKPLHFNEKDMYNVSGVFENFPQNSHFEADFILSHVHRKKIDDEGWTNNNYSTYILLKQNAVFENLEAKMSSLMDNYGWPELRKYGLDVDKLLASGVHWDFKLQHLFEAHFTRGYDHRMKPTVDIKYIYIFGLIAFIILMIASINFINLSTAKSAGRAKEVGIKKVVGSDRKELINQFLTESVVISLISFVIAVLLVELFKPVFFNILGYSFDISYLSNPWFGLSLLVIIIFTGIIAGSFPAFVLSGYRPITVLRGNLQNVMKRSWFRSGLVVFQFTTSLILIIGTLVVYNQLQYMQGKDLGFDKEHVLIVDDPYILGDNANVFKEKMLQNPSVVSATISGFLPISSYRNTTGYWRDGDKNDPKLRPHEKWIIDYDYFETFDIDIVEGRNFSEEYSRDKNAVIINEAMRDYCEWKNPLEHKLSRGEGDNTELTNYQVIGVVKNFHFTSLKKKIQPIVFHLGDHKGYAAFKVTGSIPEALNYAGKTWDELEPDSPFSYRFMDEVYNKEYKSEESMLQLFKYFAFFAIFVGCLGLFGLSAYTAEKRTKEIGIRKVHGARVLNLIYLLSKEFAILVFLSILIAAPVAYLIMDNWLEGYAYRVDLGPGTFLLAGLLALLISNLTVSYHAVKASLLNPVQSLKYE